MADRKAAQAEVDKNYKAFQRLLPTILQMHQGKYALMRQKKPVEYFDSARDAMIYGQKQFSDGLFSIQHVTAHVVDLGFFSHAVHHENI